MRGTLGCASIALRILDNDHGEGCDCCCDPRSCDCSLLFLLGLREKRHSLLLGRSLSSSLSSSILKWRSISRSRRRRFWMRRACVSGGCPGRGISPLPGLGANLPYRFQSELRFSRLRGGSGVSSLSAVSGDDIFSAPDEKSTSIFRGVVKAGLPNMGVSLRDGDEIFDGESCWKSEGCEGFLNLVGESKILCGPLFFAMRQYRVVWWKKCCCSEQPTIFAGLMLHAQLVKWRGDIPGSPGLPFKVHGTLRRASSHGG